MKDLTTQDFNVLYGKIKSFLDVTWEDIDTNTNITDAINTSIRFLDNTAGVELDYLCSPVNSSDVASEIYEQLCCEGYELLKNRCFYIREKALDDFAKNYEAELLNLYTLGKVYKEKVRENANEQ